MSCIGKGFGKVILFGEYAVLSGGYSMVFASELGASAQYQPWDQEQALFEVDGGTLGNAIFGPREQINSPFPFVQFILQNHQAPFGRYLINSEDCSIDDPIWGRSKIGLGSSSASTMALLDLQYQLALQHQSPISLDLHEYDLSPSVNDEQGLKYAKYLYFHTQNIHQKIQGLGSGADVAACAMGGYIAYSYLPISVERDFPIAIALNESHKGMIKPLLNRLNRPLLCAWSGQSASTSSLVKQVKTNTDPSTYHHICEEISHLAQEMIALWTQDSAEQILIDGLFAGIKDGEQLIKSLSQASQVELWTQMHTFIKDKVEKLGGVCKSTGAGGGDLVWILGTSAEHEKQISEKLAQDGIKCLFFNVAPRRC